MPQIQEKLQGDNNCRKSFLIISIFCAIYDLKDDKTRACKMYTFLSFTNQTHAGVSSPCKKLCGWVDLA